MLNAFCPFLKDVCKGNECVMWTDEKCLITSFMENSIKPTQEIYERSSPVVYGYEEKLEKHVPEKIKSASAEELAAELLTYVKTTYPGEEFPHMREFTTEFWVSKKIDVYQLPTDFLLKIQKAEGLAQNQIHEEIQMKLKERMEKEQFELPSLVNKCVDWAKSLGITSLTKSDVEAFLLEHDLKLLPNTNRALYVKARIQIKSKIS